MYKVSLISQPTSEDWMIVKNLALGTVGMKAKNEPDFEWKFNILSARHSPIRELKFVFRMEIPYWVSVHLARHVHAQPYVQSQRNDRQKNSDESYDRNKEPQDKIVTMFYSVNAEELMTIANKRLCFMASKETREVVSQMCDEVLIDNPEFEYLLVPSCEYNNGLCHEFRSCGKYERFQDIIADRVINKIDF